MTTFNAYASVAMKDLHHLGFLVFILFMINWAILMWTHVPKIPSVLNKGRQLYFEVFSGKSHSNFETKCYGNFRYRLSLLVLILCVPFCSSLLYLVLGMPTGYYKQMENISKIKNNSITSSIDVALGAWFPVEFETPILLYAVSILYFVITIVSEMVWQVHFLMMISWVFYFRKMLQLAIQKISASSGSAEFIHVSFIITTCKKLQTSKQAL